MPCESEATGAQASPPVRTAGVPLVDSDLAGETRRDACSPHSRDGRAPVMKRALVILLLLSANAIVSSGRMPSPACAWQKSLDFIRVFSAAIVKPAPKVAQASSLHSAKKSKLEACATL